MARVGDWSDGWPVGLVGWLAGVECWLRVPCLALRATESHEWDWSGVIRLGGGFVGLVLWEVGAVGTGRGMGTVSVSGFGAVSVNPRPSRDGLFR